MKIVLIAGVSGSGKTTICQKLCSNKQYNFIHSYTDRPKRQTSEWGHNFVSPSRMNDILKRQDDIAAQTTIDDKRYCALFEQFSTTKTNIYIVDDYGIKDIIKVFPDAQIMTILIYREEIEVDCIRQGRDVCIPTCRDVDFCITNNGDINTCVRTLDILINLDLYHKGMDNNDTNDKLDYIDEYRYYLSYIRESMLYKLWYDNYNNYIELINYLSKKINEDFDFDICIIADTEPEIDDGYLTFHILAKYTDDIDWATTHSVIEYLSSYAHNFCQEKGYNELSYRLLITEGV